MYYDPIMCMMVKDKSNAKAKDAKVFGNKTIDKAIRNCDSTSKANGYVDAIRGESESKRAEHFVRQAESDNDITDSELDRIYNAFRMKFGRKP